MRYLILGAGGMAGHLIANYLIKQNEEVEGLARRKLPYCKTHVMDITNFENVKKIIANGNYDIVVNCVGILNQSAEENPSNAILINSYLPHYLATITKELETKIIHMSTDCVFSGKKGGYTEDDVPDGKSMYDRTKALGELNDSKNLTFRNSIIGPDININGIGLFNWFMKQEEAIDGYECSLWTGVTTLTLAKAIHKASYCGLTGLYNLVNNEVISKFELVSQFNKYTNKNLTIRKIKGVVHNKSLINTRKDFEFLVPSYETMIHEMVEWIKQNEEMYLNIYKIT